jgi:L-lactate utilization protein LutC
MDSRQTILNSIRTHLAASPPEDAPQSVIPAIEVPRAPSLIDLFKENVEAVNGHCIVTRDAREAVTRIITDLGAQKVATSDAAPGADEIFEYDVGITTAQAAIADTGTLVLDSARERHRLASLVPPVHIAIVDASSIFQTLAEALAFIYQDGNVSPAVTFITGPSRTADIELTLAIGVHGPQKLYVIVNQGPPLSH